MLSPSQVTDGYLVTETDLRNDEFKVTATCAPGFTGLDVINFGSVFTFVWCCFLLKHHFLIDHHVDMYIFRVFSFCLKLLATFFLQIAQSPRHQNRKVLCTTPSLRFLFGFLVLDFCPGTAKVVACTGATPQAWGRSCSNPAGVEQNHHESMNQRLNKKYQMVLKQEGTKGERTCF